MPETVADPVLLAKQMAEMADKRIDILRRIEECGSISEAARRAGVSYKAAWQALESLTNLAGGELVERSVGGANGGGSTLTPVGRQVLEIADELLRARAEVLARFRFRDTPGLTHIGMSTLRTSMRNLFPAVIDKMTMGSAQVRLWLRIGAKNRIRASITMESSQLLGLKPDMQVLMLTKATAVEICGLDKLDTDSRANHLRGVVMRCDRERKGGEVSLQVAPGVTVIGFAKPGHGLHIGDVAVAVISPEAIVIARDT